VTLLRRQYERRAASLVGLVHIAPLAEQPATSCALPAIAGNRRLELPLAMLAALPLALALPPLDS
jgi:hypothetical protein